MSRLSNFLSSGSAVLLLTGAMCVAAQAPSVKPNAQQAKSDTAAMNTAAMKECVAREQANSKSGKEAASLACREQREAERLKELGPHSSSEVTVTTPPTAGSKMSASGHSSHSGTSGTEPSNIIQESKNTVIDKPY